MLDDIFKRFVIDQRWSDNPLAAHIRPFAMQLIESGYAKNTRHCSWTFFNSSERIVHVDVFFRQQFLSFRRNQKLMPLLMQHCPYCFSTVIQRSRRHGFPETLLRLFCIHRYRCRDCNARFYRFRTPFVKTLHAVQPRYAWKTLQHILRLK
jgi:hypothetical protein